MNLRTLSSTCLCLAALIVSSAGAATTTVQTAAAATSRPGADNTGPRKAAELRIVNGPVKIGQQGAVLEDVEVRGEILVEADDVVVRNFRVVSDGFYGVVIAKGRRGVTLEDGDISAARSAAIKGGGFTARRLNLHHLGSDAFKPSSGVVIESCWIHHIGTDPKAHADGLQIRGGVSNVVVRGNHFDMPVGLQGFRPNSAFIIDTKEGPVSDVLIEDNWINGGGWSVHIVESVTKAVVRDNYFGRDYEFGVNRAKTALWENNRWWDSGEPLSP